MLLGSVLAFNAMRALRMLYRLDPDALAGTLPDVALVDINPPGMDGVALIRELATTAPHVRVLALTISGAQTTPYNRSPASPRPGTM